MPKNLDPDFAKKVPEEDEEEGMLLEEGDEEVEESEEELSKYDEEEAEAMEEIRDMFLELVENMQKIQGNLSDILEKPTVTLAGKYRIEVTDEEMMGLDKMASLNEFIITSHIYLKNYIDFGEDNTPKFEYVKNLIFKFQQELNKEQRRTFAIVQKRDYNKQYIRRDLITNYLKGIHVHISRIIGTLKPAGDYMVVVPPRREMNRGMGQGEGMGQDIYDGDYYNQPQLYANGTNWWDQGQGSNYIRRGTRIKGKARDFGEEV